MSSIPVALIGKMHFWGLRQAGAIVTFVAVVMVLLACPASAQAQAALPANADDAVVARVIFETDEALNWAAARLDIWEVDHTARTFVALLSAEEYDDLIRSGYDVTLLPAETATLQSLPLQSAEQQAGIPGHPCYRTVEETYADLALLAAEQPDLASWIDIGDSWEKSVANDAAGYDIHALVLTNKAITREKPKLVLMAAIHAREYTTAELATRFAETLVQGYGVDADITWLLDYHELHLIPQANPDGRKQAETGLSWRKNTRPSASCAPFLQGVDLNRNSSFKWNGCAAGFCSSADPCAITYRGASPASEPETQAIETYVASLFPDRRGPDNTDAAPADVEGLFISLHSYSELILYPWGWTEAPPPNGRALQTLGRKFGYFTGYQVCQLGAPACLYPVDGSTDDWAYGTLGIAAYTFELGTQFFQSCSSFEEEILEDGLASLRYALKAARRPYLAPSGPDILDVSVSADVVDAGTPIVLQANADDTRYDSNGHGIEASQVITAARYSLDAPSWITGTATYSMTILEGTEAFTATVAASVDTTGLAAGRHLLLVEARDADGNWGVPSATFLQVLPAPTIIEKRDEEPSPATRLHLPIIH